MAHDIYWMRENYLLYVNYKGIQTPETVCACLDDMERYLDSAARPIFLLINWLEVTETQDRALRANKGHRTYSHPMAARGVLVGFDPQEAFDNEVTSVKTRGDKNTIYFKTMEEAMEYVKNFLNPDAFLSSS